MSNEHLTSDEKNLETKIAHLTFVRHLLEHPYNFDWTIQGFGMLRLYLSPTIRLHVWDTFESFPGVSTIHTHPWDFTSEVIVGRVTNHILTKVYASRMWPATHQEQLIRCGTGSCSVGQARDVHLAKMLPVTYVAGQSYVQKSHQIHESVPDRGTVTIVSRRFKEDAEHAYVYFPLGAPWGSSEPRKATYDEIDRMCGKALKVLRVQSGEDC
jgi:hypothetical protein